MNANSNRLNERLEPLLKGLAFDGQGDRLASWERALFEIATRLSLTANQYAAIEEHSRHFRRYSAPPPIRNLPPRISSCRARFGHARRSFLIPMQPGMKRRSTRTRCCGYPARRISP